MALAQLGDEWKVSVPRAVRRVLAGGNAAVRKLRLFALDDSLITMPFAVGGMTSLTLKP